MTRTRYWKNYYKTEVKPDKKKMKIRSERAKKFKNFTVKIVGSLYGKMEREAKRRKIKVGQVAEEIIRFAYK